MNTRTILLVEDNPDDTVLTSSNEGTDVAACYDLGGNSYIREPVDFDPFVEIVRQLCGYRLTTNRPPPAIA